MRRAFSPIGVGLLLLVATACAGDSSTPVATVTSTVDATAAASAVPTEVAQVQPTAVATPTEAVMVAPTVVIRPEAGPGVSDARSIDELSSGLTGALDSVDYRLGIAVLDLDVDVTYEGGDDGVFPLASVSKLALALGMLHRADLEDRELTWPERQQLASMLSESKNGPAVALWSELGASAVTEALLAYGVSGFLMPPDEQWGDMAASARDVARLLSLFVADGSPLRDDDRLLVLSLLQSVVAGQRWGVSAGVDISVRAGTTLAIKNGWYPEDEIWRVNSAGAVTVAGETGYVVVVLSDGASDFPEGVRAVEEIAAAVNGALYPEELLVALPAFVPALDESDESPGGTAGTEVVDPAVDDEPAPEFPKPEFVALDVTDDVLVLASGLISSTTGEDSFSIWFEVPEEDVDALLAGYLGSMRDLGWSTLSGPPELLLSKQDEGRFVAVRPLAGAPGGTQVIEFRIAPVPAQTVGAAAIE